MAIPNAQITCFNYVMVIHIIVPFLEVGGDGRVHTTISRLHALLWDSHLSRLFLSPKEESCYGA